MHHREVELERATWQHDIGVTADHIVFIESPTEFSEALYGGGSDPDETEWNPDVPVPFRWDPGAPGWVGVLDRRQAEAGVRWVRLDPCLVTHVLHAQDDGDAVVLYVCRYEAPEEGQPVDLDSSIVGPAGIGMSLIARGLPVLERWRIEGGSDRLERSQVDDRMVEYPRRIPCSRVGSFATATASRWSGRTWVHPATRGAAPASERHTLFERSCVPFGLLKFDLAHEDVVACTRARPPSQ